MENLQDIGESHIYTLSTLLPCDLVSLCTEKYLQTYLLADVTAE